MDTRKLKILDRMGIDVWKTRDPLPISGLEMESGSTSFQTISTAPSAAKFVDMDVMVSLGKNDRISPEPAEDGRETLTSISDEVAQCTRCSLSQTRIRVVPGEGNARADWMFVGEAPGQEEDKQGRPFVGAAGQLLNSMITALGMQRADVYIANVIKCRPPDNRNPLAEEVSSCSGFLQRQLEIVRPRVIVALGKVSAQLLLGGDESMARMRQKVYTYGDHKIPLVATYHPAYLLRSPAEKGKAWQDLLLAKSILRSASTQLE